MDPRQVLLLELFQRAQAQVTDAVDAVEPQQWDAVVLPGWTVADLVAHLVAGQLHEPLLVDDDPVPAAMPTGTEDLLAGDPLGSWEAAADGALTVWAVPRDLDVPVPVAGGAQQRVPAAVHLMDLVVQLLVHSWDLARATGSDPVGDADLVEAAWEHARRHPVRPGVPGLPVPSADPDGAGPAGAPSPAVGTDPRSGLLAVYGRRA
ncbi:maleylpyruvate isomerase N-terminal domain-containing protein [Klenkia marina]|uniref:maleylpyruvate isomerase N-terminal domain-containing protein n=1 Tax=Klenkia marina TaxID=1960309 RepID=UPI000B8420E2|nr:maleylpyruvate isomerase N-terminal domain-containing protein [Klenkia marina]